MANVDFSAQNLVHSLEQGALAPIMRILAFVAMVIALSSVYILLQFRGLNQPDAMDQAQIARAVASGEGFSTKYIRPLALWQLEQGEKELPTGAFPDFTQPPLVPLINSLPFALIGDGLAMTPLDIVAPGDRIVVVVSTLFFLLSAVIWFFVARSLFDVPLASFCLGAILLTDLLWQFSISGLPQMVVLFFFSLACLFTVKALGEGVPSSRRALTFLPLAALCFGVMVLAHGLAAWIFLGWLVFAGIFFRRSLGPVFLALVLFLAVISPWLIHNYQVCGNPFGLNIYTAIFSGNQPEMGVMRELNPDFQAAGRGLRAKLRDGIITQTSNLFGFLGLNIVAAGFFFSLLHSFRNPAAAAMRWGVLVMWIFASFGMALFGLRSEPVSSNQLHILFLPVFIFYGAGFLFVLWNRLHFEGDIMRRVYSGLLLFLVAVPMLATIFLTTPPRIQWPPYIPPFIAVLGNWFEEDEILASDMPWAVAWYADRKTILLPDSPRTLTRMNDYRVLGGPITGLYLTPITGNQPLVSQIYKGAYRHWSSLITRPPETAGFFLTAFTPLPIDGECIIYADSERWLRR